MNGIGITTKFQPVVLLENQARVGFEALARWPTLTDTFPQSVFAYAMTNGVLDRLDQHCTDSAVRPALTSAMPAGALLLINSEPSSPYITRGADHPLMQARERLQVGIELTERLLLAHPRALLRKINQLRADGFAIALDDIGAHADSLALLDVVCPDIVKLDMNLVQSQPSRDQARVLSGVLAHQEKTGAVILAEGIETDRHLEQALAVGATLGQGFLFGRAAERADAGPNWSSWSLPRRQTTDEVHTGSLFDLAAQQCSVRTGRKSTLMSLSQHIESQALHAADPPMVLAALQHAMYLTPATQRKYRQLAIRSPFVAIFGENLSSDLDEDFRGVGLSQSDPLRAEWVVLALGPHTAAALIARDHRDDSVTDDDDRLFDVAITYDRALVTSAARSLLNRIA